MGKNKQTNQPTNKQKKKKKQQSWEQIPEIPAVKGASELLPYWIFFFPIFFLCEIENFTLQPQTMQLRSPMNFYAVTSAILRLALDSCRLITLSTSDTPDAELRHLYSTPWIWTPKSWTQHSEFHFRRKILRSQLEALYLASNFS